MRFCCNDMIISNCMIWSLKKFVRRWKLLMIKLQKAMLKICEWIFCLIDNKEDTESHFWLQQNNVTWKIKRIVICNQNLAQCDGKPVSWWTDTISVGLHCSTSVPSFAPAVFKPFNETGWLKRFNEGNFEAWGIFPLGKTFLKSSFSNGTSKSALLCLTKLLLAAMWALGSICFVEKLIWFGKFA